MTHIAIVQGHPDPRGNRFGHALADAYAEGARAAGHTIERIDIVKLALPPLRSADDFYSPPPEAVAAAQEAMRRASHLLFFFPLWHGHFPALLHAFLEQTFRPGFSVAIGDGGMPRKLLTGKSARIVVTMGMPRVFYTWYFRAHGLKSLERNILRFSGIAPVRRTLIGGLGFGATGGSAAALERGFPTLTTASRRQQWIEKLHALGCEGG
jgi:putative NADPH-quinone reductase